MIVLTEAQREIEQIKHLLIDSHETAHARWTELLREKPDLALPLDTTARAQFMHCHVCDEMERHIVNLEDVTPTTRLDFFALHVGHEILLRFKFVGYGSPGNVSTTQQRYLARQEFTEDMTLALMGDVSLKPPTLLTCGYTLDGDRIGRIEIRRDCKGHQPWSFDIYGGAAVIEPLVLDGLADKAKPATVSSKGRRAEGDESQVEEA